jgi:hypothetical protein
MPRRPMPPLSPSLAYSLPRSLCSLMRQARPRPPPQSPPDTAVWHLPERGQGDPEVHRLNLFLPSTGIEAGRPSSTPSLLFSPTGPSTAAAAGPSPAKPTPQGPSWWASGPVGPLPVLPRAPPSPPVWSASEPCVQAWPWLPWLLCERGLACGPWAPSVSHCG